MGILGLCTPYQPNHHPWMGGEDECRISRSDPYKSKCNTVNNINYHLVDLICPGVLLECWNTKQSEKHIVQSCNQQLKVSVN